MENKFLKIGVGIGALLISFAAIYYFVIFMPNFDKEKLSQENLEKCAQASQQLYEKIMSDVEKEGKVFGPVHENYYNAKLNSCLLWYGYGYDGVVVQYIKNVYTNEMVVSYGQTEGKEWDISLDDFTKKRKELFNQ